MKTQKVSVDIWAMVKSMLGYVALTILGGIFIRLVVAAITLPQRLRAQRANVEKAMDELKLKYPEAFKEIAEELEIEEKEKSSKDDSDSKKIEEDAAVKPSSDNSAKEDDKKIN